MTGTSLDPRHAILFEPVPIGPKVLPNRFYQVPHASGFGSHKPGSQAAFRGIKAEGGWGGVCVEYAPVSADADESPFIAAYLRDDRDASGLAATVEAIHEHGALAGIELYHGGTSSNNINARHTRIAPSRAGAKVKFGMSARAMSADDIARVQRDFVEAAVRSRDLGFDIVYVYGAHGYLMTQFLSSFHNQRTDGYGGDIVGRSRFQLETIELVRAAVGDDCAIATRMCIDGREGTKGVHLDEMLEFIRLADPVVDLFDVIVGSWPEDSGTSRYYPEGHELPWAGRVHEATAKPVVGVGRFTSADVMAKVVKDGVLDIIGAARPAIADPFLPTKIREGRLGDVRECTGANVCIMREENFGHVGCIQNPTAGEEYRRGWHPERVPPTEDPDRSVLVVGAGPAGLECAITMARRGFSAVHLVDGQQEVGGRLRWVRRLPTLGDWGRVTDWRLTQLASLPNLEVITGRQLSADDVIDYGADIVVLATGSHWADDGRQPDHAERIAGVRAALTPERVMAGERPKGPAVTVYDCDGYYAGPGVAEQLCLESYAVTLVTPHPVVSPVSDLGLEGDMLRTHLHDLGITMRTGVTVTAVSDGGVSGHDEFGEPFFLAGDDVVLVTQEIADDALYLELTARDLPAAGISSVHLIGDALAPRWISEAVFDGHRLAREIDLPDPDFPAPLRREPLA